MVIVFKMLEFHIIHHKGFHEEKPPPPPQKKKKKKKKKKRRLLNIYVVAIYIFCVVNCKQLVCK